MNFFGHAVVACWSRASPRFVLGAILPDLNGMAGVRPVRMLDTEVDAGVTHHHRTDAVFHGLPSFVTSCTAARRELQSHGVPRGPAMAAAHVGIELLLDGELASSSSEALHTYREALHAARSAPIEWRCAKDAEQFAQVVLRLQSAHLPEAYRDPAMTGDRLLRVLARRPRLRMPPEHEAVMLRWLTQLQPELRGRVPSLLEDLRRGGL
jgi:hypothetical protein